MKRASWCYALVVLCLAAVPAGASERPIEEFVAAQGTYCIDFNADTICDYYFPPQSNFVGFIDPYNDRSILVDYAGLAGGWLRDQSGGSIDCGTAMDGVVHERELPDGRAEIQVILKTVNALTYVVDGPGLASGPLLLGWRPEDVLTGADPAIARSHLHVKFTNTAPGAPLPDLQTLLNNPGPGQELLFIQLVAEARGTLREASGYPEGTAGRAQVNQLGNFEANSHGAGWDRWPVEHIHFGPVGDP